MLQITIPGVEQWDEINQVFITMKEQTLHLEHSLISLSKWESKWCKPFISKEVKSQEETVDYIRCMTIDSNVDPTVYECLTGEHIEMVNRYIEAPMTATWFTERPGGGGGNQEQITSELIYYWMVSLNIPFECQKWHINRLLTLIRICNIKNQPPKKMGRREVMRNNAALNAARRKQHNSRG